jgi:hypothetical protein
MKLIYELNKDEYAICIIAMKCDVFYSRVVTVNQGMAFAQEHNCSYFEVSSKRSITCNAITELSKKMVNQE